MPACFHTATSNRRAPILHLVPVPGMVLVPAREVELDPAKVGVLDPAVVATWVVAILMLAVAGQEAEAVETTAKSSRAKKSVQKLGCFQSLNRNTQKTLARTRS